jgi:uncharacterized membrane protein
MLRATIIFAVSCTVVGLLMIYGAVAISGWIEHRSTLGFLVFLATFLVGSLVILLGLLVFYATYWNNTRHK